MEPREEDVAMSKTRMPFHSSWVSYSRASVSNYDYAKNYGRKSEHASGIGSVTSTLSGSWKEIVAIY